MALEGGKRRICVQRTDRIRQLMSCLHQGVAATKMQDASSSVPYKRSSRSASSTLTDRIGEAEGVMNRWNAGKSVLKILYLPSFDEDDTLV